MTALRPQRTPPVEPDGPRSTPRAAPRLVRFAVGMALLGTIGVLLLTATATRLADRRFHWWIRLTIGSPEVERVLFYVGMVALVAAWLGLARVAGAELCRPLWVSVVGFLWCVPLLIGPPLFSHDLYSYLAQGAIAHLGLNPYHVDPTVLGTLGCHHLLAGVDPFWRHSTAPYGPLFLGVISLIVALTGTHVFAGVMLVRLFDLIGLVLLAVFVPRLARRMRADPSRAVWLAVASPLVLLQLVAPGHNDLLMAGLMVAGVALALDRHPIIGIVVCTLAVTIKLPALAAVAFIAVAWMRTDSTWRARVGTAAKVVVPAVVTAAAVTLVTGFGVGWISTSLFSTPARVRLAITPATDLSFTIAKLLGDAGAAVSFSDLEPVLRAIFFACSVIVGLAPLTQARRQTLTKHLGLALAAFAIGGPALWPWYLAWGLVMLAAWPSTQNSWVIAGVVVVGSFVVRPDGILLFSRGSSPVFAALWVAIAAAGWLAWRRRRGAGPAAITGSGELSEYSAEGLGSAQSALAPR